MKKIPWKKALLVFLRVAILIHIGIIALLYFRQESMLFPGETLSPTHQYAFDLPFKEVNIPVEGASLNALHFTQPEPRGLVFFLHGNSGNLQSWTTGADYYQRVNYDMFMFDYRGYGKSSGSISSQQQLHSDVKAAWDFIAKQYPDKPIVIYGRSLGTGLAVELATKVKAEQLILVSPYESMLSMAKKRFPLIPDFILRYPLRTDQIIPRIKIPTAFFHGAEDALIPAAHSEKLRALMSIDAELFIIDEAGHGDIHQYDAYTDNLTALLP